MPAHGWLPSFSLALCQNCALARGQSIWGGTADAVPLYSVRYTLV